MYPINEEDTPITRITSRTEYPAYGLIGDQSYIFQVTAVYGTLRSKTSTQVVKTRKCVWSALSPWTR